MYSIFQIGFGGGVGVVAVTSLEAQSRYAMMTLSFEWQPAAMRGVKQRLKALTTCILVMAWSCSTVIEPVWACQREGGEGGGFVVVVALAATLAYDRLALPPMTIQGGPPWLGGGVESSADDTMMGSSTTSPREAMCSAPQAVGGGGVRAGCLLVP